VAEGQRVAVRESVPAARGIRVYGSLQHHERSGLFGRLRRLLELPPGTLLEPLPDDVAAAELTVWEPLASRPVGDAIQAVIPSHPWTRHLGWPRLLRPKRRGRADLITGTASDQLRLEAATDSAVEETINVSLVPRGAYRELRRRRRRRNDAAP